MNSETRSSELELHKAIHKLDEFSRRLENDSKKPLHFVRALFKGQTPLDSNEVSKAVEVIKRERFRLQKMKEGNQDERKLYEFYTHAIDNFNRKIDKKGKKNTLFSKAFSSRLESAFLSLPKIELPAVPIKKYYPSMQGQEQIPINKKITTLQQNLIGKVLLSRQSAELFQMKVLALLERYGIATNPEARQAVKKTPIQTSIEESGCTLTQTIQLFPGQTIVVKGLSELDLQTQTISRLFPESFSVSFESLQTGYPYPSQRAGWSLTHHLIPDCLHYPELLPELTAFFQQREKIIQGLQHSPELLAKAKQILQSKRQVFDQNKEEFLAMHRQLALTFLSASENDSEPAQKTVNDFFQSLLQHPNPYDRLCEIYGALNERYISKPQNALALACGEEKKPSYQQAVELLDKTLLLEKPLPHTKIENDYITCMGLVIGKAVKKILLLFFSEDLIYNPPNLTPFEKAILQTAFMQSWDFFRELETDPPMEQVEEHLRSQMQADLLRFFELKEFGVTDQLLNYFKQRFQQQAG